MSSQTPRPRWFDARTSDERLDYAYRFIKIAERGEDIDGEARFIDALADRGSVILDAGCGVGRTAAALATAGHTTVGIDVDPVLIEKGSEFYPELPLVELDLVQLNSEALDAKGLPATYDVIVCAGNVLLFVAPQTQAQIVANLAQVLRPGGRIAVGFQTAEAYTHDHLDVDAASAGLTREHRFATWQFDPTAGDDTWAVSVYRRR